MGNRYQNDHGGHNVEALLMKYDLEEEQEIHDPISVYQIHYMGQDTPLYIQFADDGYDFDPKNL